MLDQEHFAFCAHFERAHKDTSLLLARDPELIGCRLPTYDCSKYTKSRFSSRCANARMARDSKWAQRRCHSIPSRCVARLTTERPSAFCAKKFRIAQEYGTRTDQTLAMRGPDHTTGTVDGGRNEANADYAYGRCHATFRCGVHEKCVPRGAN